MTENCTVSPTAGLLRSTNLIRLKSHSWQAGSMPTPSTVTSISPIPIPRAFRSGSTKSDNIAASGGVSAVLTTVFKALIALATRVFSAGENGPEKRRPTSMLLVRSAMRFVMKVALLPAVWVSGNGPLKFNGVVPDIPCPLVFARTSASAVRTASVIVALPTTAESSLACSVSVGSERFQNTESGSVPKNASTTPGVASTSTSGVNASTRVRTPSARAISR